MGEPTVYICRKCGRKFMMDEPSSYPEGYPKCGRCGSSDLDYNIGGRFSI